MEKPKFEFQKLELPKTFNSSIEEPNIDAKTQSISEQPKKPKPFQLASIILATTIGLTAGYYAHTMLNVEIPQKIDNFSENKAKNALIPPIIADSSKKSISKKPVYFNYYDSIIFLNDVKGTKIVVSKGFDEYIKKEKLIVKSDGYYFNLFCKNLYSNYSVGDTIP